MSDPNRAAMMLFSPEGRANPYPFYATLRDAAAVFKTPFGGFMVARYETVDRILRSSAFRTPRGYREANDPAGPPRFDAASALGLHRRHWLIFQSDEAHTRLRKLIMKVFTPRAVRALAPRIEGIVDELLAPALERGSMEVISDLAYPLPATVICELLGIPAADRDRNRAWAAVTAATVDPMCTDAQIKAAETAMEEWDGYIREIDETRRPTMSDGDRELCAIEPLTFDAPETTPFVDSKTGTLFSSDGFGAILSATADHAAEIPASALREGVVTWTTVDSPWLRWVDKQTLEMASARIRDLAPPVVLSSHLPPAFGMLDVLLDRIATARAQPRFVGPDQAALTALLASLAQPDGHAQATESFEEESRPSA